MLRRHIDPSRPVPLHLHALPIGAVHGPGVNGLTYALLSVSFSWRLTYSSHYFRTKVLLPCCNIESPRGSSGLRILV